jgi:hypothetical protein
MLLQLKNNHIYLPYSNVVLASEDAHFLVNILDIDSQEYQTVAIVNGEAIPFVNEFVIERNKLKTPYLDIAIEATHKTTGKIIKYIADKYPITKAVVLGKPCSEWYPAIFKSILDRLELLEKYKSDSQLTDSMQTKEIASIKENIKLVELAIKEINEIGEVV